jgi:drug/metabolite transporter (DMT)-like permease
VVAGLPASRTGLTTARLCDIGGLVSETTDQAGTAPAPRTTRPDRAAIAAFVGVVLFGGANGIAVRATVHELAPFWGAAIRFLAAGVILVAIVLATRRAFPRGRSLIGAVLYGTIGFAGSFGFIYSGLRDASAGTLGVLLALTPLFTFGLAIVHRQERFHPQGLLGAVIALAGVAFIFADQVGANVPIGSMVLILFGVACIAESGVVIKWIPRSDPFGTNAVAMLSGAVLLLTFSLVAGEPKRLPNEPATWAAIGYLVLFGSVALFSLFVFALQRWTASAVSYTTLLMPIVTVSLATRLTGERISPSFAVGGAVILAGVYAGAFLKIRPWRSSASSSPECLPIDACAEVVPAKAA